MTKLLIFNSLLFFFALLSVIDARVYDYVVIGGGTGGAAAAKRLSDPSLTSKTAPSVLVLEAGYNFINNSGTQNFKIGYTLQKDPRYGFYHIGRSVSALGGRRLEYPPARMWGGTSSINGALWVRGNEYDSKVYAKFGGHEWNHTNNIADFRKMENFTAVTDQPQYHGTTGEIDVISQRPSPSPVWEQFKSAVTPLFPNLTEIVDYNGASQEGIFRSWQFTVQNKGGSYVRESAATAFFEKSVDGNGNGIGGRDLTINSNAFVTRLIFRAGTTKVTRVEFINADGEYETVRVGEEVILAAGTVGTPAILLRSGVGPCSELALLGITCVVDSPYVGKNVQEHGLIQLILETPASLAQVVRDYNNAPDSNGFIFGGWTRSPYASYFSDPSLGTPPPDVELNWKVASLYGGEINNLYALDNFNAATNTPRARPVISMSIFQQKPICRGFVTLADYSPSYAPSTYFCFGGDNRLNGSSVDMAYNEWTLRVSAQIVANLQNQSNPDWKAVFPTAEQLSPQNIAQTTRAALLSGWHPVGSARMGARNSVQQGVVDGSSLCVHGAENIRVADLSIYPETPTGNTQAWAYLAGVRAAKFALRGICPTK